MVSHILLYENSTQWIILSQIPLFIWFSFVEENAEKETLKKRKNKEKKNQALLDFEPLFLDMSWMKLSAFSAIFPIDVHWWGSVCRLTVTCDCTLVAKLVTELENI